MKEIIYEWNPWWSQEYSFKGISRDKLQDILPWLQRREIVSIVGVRRAGKTTLLYEIISHLINQNKVNPKNILFIKADDDRVSRNSLVDLALGEYRQWINPSSAIFVFIDEVQEINDWQKTLKRIYDLQKDVKLFVSGSNASLLKEDISSFLAGRFACFEIFPFSFSEFLRAKRLAGKEFGRDRLRHLLLEYLNTGSFPEVVLEMQDKTKRELLGFYFDSIFYRDVIKRRAIRNPAKLEKLVKYFLQNIASPANFTKIAKLLDLTTDSVVDYTKALEDAYLIFPINLFEFSYKKQVINPKKIYCVDAGIRNIVGFTFSEDIGRVYENAVFVQLKRDAKEIYYWKNKSECDFLIKDGKKLAAIQVCYDLTNAKERELQGLLEALKQFKLSHGLVITDNHEAEEFIGTKKIVYVPLWKWLLKDEAAQHIP